MAEYRIRETGQVVTESEFRSMYPDTSFPYQITEEVLDEFGADLVFEGPQPTATKYQVVYRDGVYQDEQGRWFTQYSVADMDEDGIAAVDAATRETNRNIRNSNLRSTDWTQLPDVGLTSSCKAAFAVYRQTNRDVDLLNPSWPDLPEEEWAA